MPSAVPETAAAPGPRAMPAFLLAIDTEGDDIWARPREVTTRNARYLRRFQDLCDRFGFPPTYLTNFEMANDDAFGELARDVLARGTAEIGMHMHAWDTPPLVPLGARDWSDQPYAFKYWPDLVARKVETMTRLLEDRFGVAATSHRAGRFGLDAAYARALAASGYRVDCSVTPRVTWAAHPGAPDGSGGPDFRAFPTGSYWLDGTDIARPGTGTLLEVPMTIVEGVRPWPRALARRLLGRRDPRIVWLRPDGTNLADLLFIVATAKSDRRPYIQFTLHSSEFMPGGSPTFRTEASIERLYDHLEVLFEAIRGSFQGRTLTAFADGVAPAASASARTGHPG